MELAGADCSGCCRHDGEDGATDRSLVFNDADLSICVDVFGLEYRTARVINGRRGPQDARNPGPRDAAWLGTVSR
jgi:hypothetical protein